MHKSLYTLTGILLLFVATAYIAGRPSADKVEATLPAVAVKTSVSPSAPETAEDRAPQYLATPDLQPESATEPADASPSDAIPLASAELPPSSEFQAKLSKLPIPRLIPNPRAFIDQHGMADLTPEQRASLGMTLNSCAVEPLRDKDAMANRRAELYAEGMDEAMLQRRTVMCGSITDEEFYASYHMLRTAAESGDRLALEVYANAFPPTMIEASLYHHEGAFDDIAAYNALHLQGAVDLLERSTVDGNIRAARTLIHIYWPTNDGGPQRDLVKALALSKAVAYAEGATRYNKSIEILSDKMFFYEIEQADALAIATVWQWSTLETLSN